LDDVDVVLLLLFRPGKVGEDILSPLARLVIFRFLLAIPRASNYKLFGEVLDAVEYLFAKLCEAFGDLSILSSDVLGHDSGRPDIGFANRLIATTERVKGLYQIFTMPRTNTPNLPLEGRANFVDRLAIGFIARCNVNELGVEGLPVPA
jgi:hypothetical protein